MISCKWLMGYVGMFDGNHFMWMCKRPKMLISKHINHEWIEEKVKRENRNHARYQLLRYYKQSQIVKSDYLLQRSPKGGLFEKGWLFYYVYLLLGVWTGISGFSADFSSWRGSLCKRTTAFGFWAPRPLSVTSLKNAYDSLCKILQEAALGVISWAAR